MMDKMIEFLLANVNDIGLWLFLGGLAFLFERVRSIFMLTIRLFISFFKKAHKIELNQQNIFIARFQAPECKDSGHFGIGFYGLSVINNTSVPMRIKTIELMYKLNGRNEYVTSRVVFTATKYHPLSKNQENILLTVIGKNPILAIGWNNIKIEIAKEKILEPKIGALSGSAYFVLGFNEEEKLSQIEDVKVVIVDCSGQKSTHKVSLQGSSDNQGLELINRPFSLDENDIIIMAPN